MPTNSSISIFWDILRREATISMHRLQQWHTDVRGKSSCRPTNNVVPGQSAEGSAGPYSELITHSITYEHVISTIMACGDEAARSFHQVLRGEDASRHGQ